MDIVKVNASMLHMFKIVSRDVMNIKRHKNFRDEAPMCEMKNNPERTNGKLHVAEKIYG